MDHGTTIVLSLWCVLTRAQITTNSIACAIAAVSDKFRSPAFRPIRAAMFVGLGLSAIFPVMSGLNLYGLGALRERIALDWLVAHGLMYIIGAAIYAVSPPAASVHGVVLTSLRPDFPNAFGRAALTSGVALTRSSMSWCCALQLPTWLA